MIENNSKPLLAYIIFEDWDWDSKSSIVGWFWLRAFNESRYSYSQLKAWLRLQVPLPRWLITGKLIRRLNIFPAVDERPPFLLPGALHQSSWVCLSHDNLLPWSSDWKACKGVFWSSKVALVVKNLPVNAGDVRDEGSILGWEDPLEEEMATHSTILTWEIPWTQKCGG